MATRVISTSIKLDGEAEFKKQMSSVNSELKTLRTEMAYSEEAFKGQANTMEALTAKDKLLRKEIEQQEEKVRALEQAVSDASEAYGDNDKRTDSWRQSLNRAKTDLLKMNRELEDNSKYLSEAEKSHKKTASSIDEYGRAVDSGKEKTSIFGEVLKANLASEAIITGAKGLAAGLREIPAEVLERSAEALKALITGMKDAAVAAAAYADDILTTSTVTGLSTDALQEYQYMAELTDVSVDTITGSLTKLTKNMESAKGGTGSAAEAFKALGVSVTDSEGQLRSNQEVFGEVIDKLGEMDNETQRDAYSMSIFGKSAQDLNPLIAQGSDGIAAFAEEAHNMGYVLDGETLSSLGAVDDAVQRFEKALEAAKNQAGAEFAPAMESIFTGITEIISGNVDEGLSSIEKGLEQFEDKLDELGPYAEEALTKFLETFTDHLPELAETGVRLLLTLIVGIAKAAPQLIPAAAEAVQTIVDALWDNRGLIVEAGENLIRGLWEGIKSMGAWLLDKIKGVVGGIKEAFTGKDGFDEHSPSRWSMTVMEYVMDGLVIGAENRKGKVMETVEDLVDEAKGRFSDLQDVLEGRQNVSDLEYQLWERTAGKTATEAEKLDKKLEILGQQQLDQEGILQGAEAAYQAIAEQYGENSDKSIEFQQTLLKEKLKYLDLLDAIEEVISAKQELGLIDGGVNERAVFSSIQESASAQSGAVTVADLREVAAATVNGMSTAMGEKSEYIGTTVIQIDGQTFARVTQPYFRSEDKSNPEVVSDV